MNFSTPIVRAIRDRHFYMSPAIFSSLSLTLGKREFVLVDLSCRILIL